MPYQQHPETALCGALSLHYSTLHIWYQDSVSSTSSGRSCFLWDIKGRCATQRVHMHVPLGIWNEQEPFHICMCESFYPIFSDVVNFHWQVISLPPGMQESLLEEGGMLDLSCRFITIILCFWRVVQMPVESVCVLLLIFVQRRWKERARDELLLGQSFSLNWWSMTASNTFLPDFEWNTTN